MRLTMICSLGVLLGATACAVESTNPVARKERPPIHQVTFEGGGHWSPLFEVVLRQGEWSVKDELRGCRWERRIGVIEPAQWEALCLRLHESGFEEMPPVFGLGLRTSEVHRVSLGVWMSQDTELHTVEDLQGAGSQEFQELCAHVRQIIDTMEWRDPLAARPP